MYLGLYIPPHPPPQTIYMMRFTLTTAIVALTNAGHDSWGCWPEGGWTADEAGEAGLPSNFCVVGGDGQPIAKGLPGFSSGGVVGVVVLGAAGADGKPKLACGARPPPPLLPGGATLCPVHAPPPLTPSSRARSHV